MAIILPDLPYAYDALEPYIVRNTLAPPQTYVNNANAALERSCQEIGEDLETTC